jgi:co-chaperonin GroES (HSP10)
MASDSYLTGFVQLSMEAAFPPAPVPVEPFGGRVVVQVMRLSGKTAGGIQLVSDTRDTVKWNLQVAKLVAVGPLAFKNRETAQPWPEGVWAKVGDFVRIPRWDGDRVEVKVKDSDEPIIFITMNDSQLLGRVLGDPREQLIYEL